MPAARNWSAYEGACSTLLPSPDTVARLRAGRGRAGDRAPRGALLPQGIFLPEDELIANRPHPPHPGRDRAGPLRLGLPDRSGRRSAARLAGGRVHIVADAGHSAMEPGIRAALIAGMEAFKSVA